MIRQLREESGILRKLLDDSYLVMVALEVSNYSFLPTLIDISNDGANQRASKHFRDLRLELQELRGIIAGWDSRRFFESMTDLQRLSKFEVLSKLAQRLSSGFESLASAYNSRSDPSTLEEALNIWDAGNRVEGEVFAAKQSLDALALALPSISAPSREVEIQVYFPTPTSGVETPGRLAAKLGGLQNVGEVLADILELTEDERMLRLVAVDVGTLGVFGAAKERLGTAVNWLLEHLGAWWVLQNTDWGRAVTLNQQLDVLRNLYDLSDREGEGDNAPEVVRALRDTNRESLVALATSFQDLVAGDDEIRLATQVVRLNPTRRLEPPRAIGRLAEQAGAVAYRRSGPRNVWHWCTNCPDWPPDRDVEEERVTLEPPGRPCRRCQRLSAEGSCTPGV